MNHPLAIAEGIYWVGAIDWNIRHFHGPAFSTHRGTTYNAYYIVDEKTALVDTVYEPFQEELIAKLKKIQDPVKIEYLVVNHTENDHAGAFPAIMNLCPTAHVLCTQRGYESLKDRYPHLDFQYTIVKTGTRITLGKRSLLFIEAPMLHWPDSMFTYVPEESLLMPNDAFGQHIASSARFDDQVDLGIVMDEAAKYYANILMPFSSLITKKLEEIQKMNLEIKTIAPSHGIIWRRDPGRILNAYARWAEGQGAAKAVIAYDTMWLSTERMAYALLDGLVSGGCDARLFKLSLSDRNDIIKELLDARALLVGSPTINNDILPVVSPLLDDLVGLRPKNKIGLAFGAYGWGGGAQKILEERLKAAKIELFVEPGPTVKWVPKPEDLQLCYQLGRELAARIKD
ncbi:FprA family A-type flavoprotein [Thermanaeromonas sp. C210]|uniref:FprA family A-type flavoprotein n=1 Tax=Thermanaeromonas sp. C210 TaxID=2731925 RepID=UPI00155B7392|nr:flavodoxin domain-containing protein [Thermanaeromonas sp. C210]GFN23981.1 nitric oxide reductase [Thermanaeromonas sp. C210]